jgi:hypothetical protein
MVPEVKRVKVALRHDVDGAILALGTVRWELSYQNKTNKQWDNFHELKGLKLFIRPLL